MPQTAKDLIAQAKSEISPISCEEYNKLKNEKTLHTLIDVREKDEWDAGHIDGAVHIPRGVLEFKVEGVVPDKDSLVVVHCASGGRGALCGQALQKMGYTNLKNLEGGYGEYCKIVQG